MTLLGEMLNTGSRLLLDWRFYVFVLFAYLVWFYIKVFFSGLPRGPIPLPFLGNALQLKPQVHTALVELGKTYGEVFTIYIINQPVVILNTFKAMDEGFVKHGKFTSDRPDHFPLMVMNQGKNGIVFAHQSIWKEHRHFAIKVLRDLGMGKPILEQRTQVEAAAIIEAIRGENGQPFDPRKYMQLAVANIIFNLLFGRRYSYDDDTYWKVVSAVLQDISFMVDKFLPLVSMPWLRFVPGDPFCFYKMKQNLDFKWKWFQEQIDEKRKTYDENNLDDYISHYFHQGDKMGEDSTFTNQQLMMSITDLLAAGIDTTSTTMIWFFLYMLYFPDVKKKMVAEIDNVVGRHRPTSLKDRTNMPYTEAFVNELCRIASVGPLALMHHSCKEIEVRGTKIPSGSWLWPNIYNVHYDEEYFEAPDDLRPERFMDKKKLERLLTFNTGPRVCLGEALARTEMFLFIATLLQNFDFEKVPGQQLPELKGVLGITLVPYPYKIIAKERP